MYNRYNTRGIVLARTNYGEADRILTFLTPDQGKLKAIAKGVRRQKSKLAGGIELFSVSDLGLIAGRSEINTLVSSRLVKYYSNIVKDTDRTAAAYELIKSLNKNTEDQPETGYFTLLKKSFQALDDVSVDPQLALIWAYAQLLRLGGHSPNLSTDTKGAKLEAGKKYAFNLDNVAFSPSREGLFDTSQIKFIRLIFSDNQPNVLAKIKGLDQLLGQSKSLIQPMLLTYIRI